MKPTRAAWFFAAGLVWLVLRGILVYAVPQLRTEYVAQQGGLLLLVPLVSVIASLTVPVFFLSFLRHHQFGRQLALKTATGFALVASLLSFVLVLISFVLAVVGISHIEKPLGPSLQWMLPSIPLVFVVSLFLFLVAFARQSGCGDSLRRAATAGALGTLVPMILITVWVLHSSVDGVFTWYPAASRSLLAKLLGLAAAGTLLWFLETFAVSYAEPTDDGQ